MTSSQTNKPVLAIVVSRFPYPLEKGDKLRAYYQIKELSKDYQIHLFALTESNVSQSDRDQLEKHCHKIYIYRIKPLMKIFQLFLSFISKRPFQVGYFYDPRIKRKINIQLEEIKPNHIYCQLIRSSEYIKNYHYCPKTLDYMDALSKGMERRIEKAPFLLRWLFRSEAQRLSSYERTIFSYFEHKTIISEQDRELIFHPERSKIKCIPNGIDESFFESIPTNSKFDLVFVGNLSYAPNVEAVEFIDDLLRTKKNLTCLVSGANPSSSVKKITSRNKAITLQGWTEDIRTAYCSGKIFIAPMMIGTGMQNKLLEAMALGIPCITTPLANNAIQGKNNQSILVAETKQDFIDCIEKLLSDQKTYESIKVEGIQHVRNNFSWKHSVETLKNNCFNTL